MQIITQLTDSFSIHKPVLTIGNFDGVHLGHQKIFKQVAQKSALIKGSPVAMTFDPHPIRALSPDKGFKLILPIEEKYKLIFAYGIEKIIVVPFDKTFASTEPEDFIKNIIVDKINASWVIVGHNYNFGKAKKGNTKLLRARCKSYGFGLTVVRSATVSNHIISSSAIRALISKGRVYEASLMLGRFYYIDGFVVRGTGRGSSVLQIPTANISTHYELLPKDGVYAVKVKIDDCMYNGAANLGANPTFDNQNFSCEVHIFNYTFNLLGKAVRVFFIQRLRDEKRFNNLAELKNQIIKDIAKSKEILSNVQIK